MEKKTVNVIYAAVLIGLLLFFVWRYMPFESEIHPDQLTFEDESGRAIRLVENSDKPFLIHFYASWCGPCMAEFPELVLAYPKLKNQYHLFVLTDDSWKKINQTKERFKATFPIYKLSGSIKDAGVYNIPATAEVDAAGKVLKFQSGRWPWAEY